MSEPVEPQREPDPRLSRPVPDIAFDPVELPGAPAPRPDAPPVPPAVTVPRVETVVEPPSPDVVLPDPTPAPPGAHRGGFTTAPTAPVELVWQGPARVEESAPMAGTATLAVGTSAGWNPGAYALLFAIAGLAASLVVGWLFPLGLTGVVFAVIALRRPSQRRRGVWALVLAFLSLGYSAGWLLYAALA